MDIQKKGTLGVLMALGLLVAACDQAPEGSDDGDKDQQEGTLLGGDCNDQQPAAQRCVQPNVCNREVGRCLPPNSECYETSDCSDGEMCTAGYQCEPTGCGMEQNICDRTEFNPGDGSAGSGRCDLVAPTGCCTEDAQCDEVGSMGAVCDLDRNRCVECLRHSDCNDDQMCDLENMVCRDVPCEDDPDLSCDWARINPETRMCEHGIREMCCEGPWDDGACRKPCANDAECGQGWECRALSRASYCVLADAPLGTALGCSTDQVMDDNGVAGFVCTWCDDQDRDGYCADEEVCDDGRDNDGDGQVDMCDPNDTDGDGVPNLCGEQPCTPDNCPDVINPEQSDTDGDDIGDACDPERNCGEGFNPCQEGNNCVDGVCSLPGCAPGVETCNGQDDDCDGMIDEDFAGVNTPCSAGDGACMAAGTWVCNQAGNGLTCNAVAGQPVAETCDGLDNNCDGMVDSTQGQVVTQPCYTGLAGTQNVGLCHGGTQTCANGAYGACANEVTPVAEICGNGTDDDCDGVVDDGCAPADPDGDGLVGEADNCPNAWNPAQADRDGDGTGNACDNECALNLMTQNQSRFEYSRSAANNVNQQGLPNAAWNTYAAGIRELCVRANEAALLTATDGQEDYALADGDPCQVANIVQDNSHFRAGAGPADFPAWCGLVCTASGPGWLCDPPPQAN